MKKFILAIISLFLVATLVSCKKTVQETNETTTESPTTATAETKNENINENQSEIFVTEETADNFSSATEKQTVADSTEKKPDFLITTTVKSTTEQKTVKIETTTKVTTTSPGSKIQVTYHPEKEIKDLHNTINKYRQENGLSPMTLDPELCQLAYQRACEQVILSGHTRPDGSKAYTILDENGYPYSATGENLCYLHNYPVETAFGQWKKSTTHNENMLYPEWTKSGLALYEKSPGEYEIAHIFVS